MFFHYPVCGRGRLQSQELLYQQDTLIQTHTQPPPPPWDILPTANSVVFCNPLGNTLHFSGLFDQSLVEANVAAGYS